MVQLNDLSASLLGRFKGSIVNRFFLIKKNHISLFKVFFKNLIKAHVVTRVFVFKLKGSMLFFSFFTFIFHFFLAAKSCPKQLTNQLKTQTA